jgi:nicotinamidase-related amidase
MRKERNHPKASQQAKNDDLHGNAPDRSPVALLLIDVINDLDFPRNENLVRNSVGLAKRIAALKGRCKKAGIPVIYVNDNKGKWRSEFSEAVKRCSRRSAPGHAMVKRLTPTPADYIVLKPKHSAFYATPLEILLESIGARTIIVAGLTTNACVMITASDCYIRDFELRVPRDCVAALTEAEQRNALTLMEKNFGAQTMPADQIDLKRLTKRRSE